MRKYKERDIYQVVQGEGYISGSTRRGIYI